MISSSLGTKRRRLRQLSVTVDDALRRGRSGRWSDRRRVVRTGEEVVIFQFAVLRELQHYFGLLDVAVDGRD